MEGIQHLDRDIWKAVGFFQNQALTVESAQDTPATLSS
jgi:hypothetical protein